MTLKRACTAAHNRTLANAWTVEKIEPRQFYSVTYYSDPSQLSASGSYFGSVLYGDNGSDWGTPTAINGYSNTVENVAFPTWDEDPDDGLDSGVREIAFCLNTDSAHLASWKVDGNEVGTFGVSSSTAVHSVTLLASVGAAGLQFAFSNVQVCFYSSGTLVETVNVSGFSADTRTSASSASAAAVVTPTGSNISGVYVSAKIQMGANYGTYPGAMDLFGKIAIS